VWFLRGRRFHDDVVELPVFAAVKKRLVGGPGVNYDMER